MNKQILFHGSSTTLELLQQQPQLKIVVLDNVKTMQKLVLQSLAVIIEINEPEHDFAWLSTLQAISLFAPVPKIALVRPEHFKGAIAAGATELLYQPLNITELEVRLNTLWKQQQESLLGSLDVLTHDLNSPLGIIEYSLQLVLEILEDEPSPETLHDIRQFVENMLIASYRLRMLSMDTLDYIRLIHQQLQPINKTIEVIQVIQDAIQNVAHSGNENHIKVAFHPPSSPIQIKTDKNLLQRSIEAALDTSIKFCQPRSTIDISCQINNGQLIINIRDYGQPVDPAYLPNIVFAPYVQSAMREDGKRSAVGLSLPFISAAIEALGGKVTINSDDSCTTLEIILPM